MQTFAELLRAAYAGKRKRLTVSKNAVEAIQAAPKPEHAERTEILNLAKVDRILERTRDLMLFSADRLGLKPLAVLVREFVGEVLRQHPAHE